MSLGDLGNNINKSGANLYNLQRQKMMREAKDMQNRQSLIEADRLNKEIAHLRLSRQTIEGRIMQVKMDINREKDPRTRSIKQTELHKLINDKVHLEGEIMVKQGRESAAHNVRYNNPHYF